MSHTVSFSNRTLAIGLLFVTAALFFAASALSALPKKPNPASGSCKERGGEHRILRDPDGSQRGICFFGGRRSVCEEWAFFNNECRPGDCPTRCENGQLLECRGALLNQSCSR